MAKNFSKYKKSYLGITAFLLSAIFIGIVYAASAGQLNADFGVSLLPPKETFYISEPAVVNGIRFPRYKKNPDGSPVMENGSFVLDDKGDGKGGWDDEKAYRVNDTTLAFEVMLFGPGHTRKIEFFLQNNTMYPVELTTWDFTPDSGVWPGGGTLDSGLAYYPDRSYPTPNPASPKIKVTWPDFSGVGQIPPATSADHVSGRVGPFYITVTWVGSPTVWSLTDKDYNGVYATAGAIGYNRIGTPTEEP
ncbi:MAG: hypothetical protein FWD58_04950 [Firmicutes bacterium]|nr:hypothetical protein [Bacillota bacterium]